VYVSRETTGPAQAMFHVKQPPDKMNEKILLTNTEIPKDHIQNIFDVDPPQEPPQGMNRDPQVLRGEFLTLPNRIYAALKRNYCLLQQFSLPLPADQAALA
jgi:hypothetical protein